MGGLFAAEVEGASGGMNTDWQGIGGQMMDVDQDSTRGEK